MGWGAFLVIPGGGILENNPFFITGRESAKADSVGLLLLLTRFIMVKVSPTRVIKCFSSESS